jgi:RHS repeat-associated protein
MLVEEEWDEKVKLFSYTDLLYTEGGVDYYSPLLTGTDVIPTISGVGLVSEPVVTAGGSHPVRVEDYIYDGAGRMVGTTPYEGSGIPGMTMDSVDVQSYDLDAFGNPLETQVSRLTPLTPSLVSGGNISQWTYDDMGRPETRQTQTSFGLGLAGGGTAWTWYADGSLASIDTPGLQSLEYVRSLSGGEFELDTIKVNGSAAMTVSSRDALGRILGASFGGDTHAFGYDPMGRLDSRILTSSGGLTSTWTAFFTDDGQLESEQISDFNGSTWSNDYTYFEEGWLKSEVRGATGETRDYTYDSGGRRTETYVNGTLERATNWAGSRVVDIDGVAVDYDGLDGVELDHLDYAYERDATGRVAEMSDGTSGSSLYQMMRDEAGRVVALDDGAGPRVTTWGLGLGGLPLEVEDSSGALLNYVGAEGIVFGLSDGSSLTSVMTDGAGSLLQVGSEAVEPGTAFGEGTSVSSTDARFAFAGLEALPGAPGVQMSQQRMYDSETGRFLSPDPIGRKGGPHRTRYGKGNPTRFVDPSGYYSTPAPDYMNMSLFGSAGYYTPNMGLDPSAPAAEYSAPVLGPLEERADAFAYDPEDDGRNGARGDKRASRKKRRRSRKDARRGLRADRPRRGTWRRNVLNRWDVSSDQTARFVLKGLLGADARGLIMGTAWLFGRGKDRVYDNNRWSAYLMESPEMQSAVQSAVEDHLDPNPALASEIVSVNELIAGLRDAMAVQEVDSLPSSALAHRVPSEGGGEMLLVSSLTEDDETRENWVDVEEYGEFFTGYDFMTGTNDFAGGLRLNGTVEVDEESGTGSFVISVDFFDIADDRAGVYVSDEAKADWARKWIPGTPVDYQYVVRARTSGTFVYDASTGEIGGITWD